MLRKNLVESEYPNSVVERRSPRLVIHSFNESFWSAEVFALFEDHLLSVHRR